MTQVFIIPSMELDPIEVSGVVGLVALGMLTANLLLGLLLARHYNPVRNWPHHRIDTVRIHNWIGYGALFVSTLHPLILLLPSKVQFDLVDLVWPFVAPRQPLINAAGALALYLLAFIIVTSVLRFRLGRKIWKATHYMNYVLFVAFAVHSVFTDPKLDDKPIDYLDGEKVFVEICLVALAVAIAMRARMGLRRRRESLRGQALTAG